MQHVWVKDSRLAVRLSSEQDALIRRAAQVEGTSITEFTVDAAVSHARDVLVDRRLFMLDDAAWTEFLAVLDPPIAYCAGSAIKGSLPPNVPARAVSTGSTGSILPLAISRGLPGSSPSWSTGSASASPGGRWSPTWSPSSGRQHAAT